MKWKSSGFKEAPTRFNRLRFKQELRAPTAGKASLDPRKRAETIRLNRRDENSSPRELPSAPRTANAARGNQAMNRNDNPKGAR